MSNPVTLQVPNVSGGEAAYTGENREIEVMRMRILVADAQPKVRFALKVLLEHQSELEVVGETGSAMELLDMLDEKAPDVLLVGWELPGLAANGSVTAFQAVRPEIIVVALSAIPEARKCALESGADFFVSKSDPPERLLAALREAHCRH
jgi:DNA-binding NarL/FixJ family response regulator